MLANAQKKNILWESISCSTSVFWSCICLTGNFLGLAVVSKYFMALTEQLLITERQKKLVPPNLLVLTYKKGLNPHQEQRGAGDVSARDLLNWARAKCARDSFQDTQLLLHSTTNSLWRRKTPSLSQKKSEKWSKPSCGAAQKISPLKIKWVNWWSQAHTALRVGPTLGKLGRGCNTCQEGVWRKGHQL